MKSNHLETSRLILRSPKASDAEALVHFYKINSKHLSPWETALDLKPAAVKSMFKTWAKERRMGASVRFFIFTRENPNEIIGLCNFTQIFRGGFQACYLGYKLSKKHEGQGLMKEALEASIHFMFNEIGLHRIMANYMPKNIRSANLLSNLGFRIEGYAPKYLLINGAWEDHVLTAKIN